MPTFLGHASQLAVVHAAAGCTIISPTQEYCTVSSGLTALAIAFIVIAVAIAVLGIVAGVKIVSKAGYSGWWILVTFVPVIGSIFVFIFAFSDWPVLREVRMLRGASRSVPAGAQWPGAYGAAGAPRGTPSSPASVEDAPMPSFAAGVRGGPAPGDAEAPGGPTPGWYDAPDGPQGRLRYWDGSAWTEHYR